MDLLTKANKIYTVLVNICGAEESGRMNFIHRFPTLTEYRFIGALEFGGKYYKDGRVTCYPEDETPERLTMIKEANQQIQRILSLKF